MINKFIKIPKDPFDVILWLLESIGQLKDKKRPIRSTLITLVSAFGIINCLIGPLLYAYKTDDLSERTMSMLISMSGLHICTKFYNCYSRERKVRSIIANVRSLWDSQDIREYKLKMKNEIDKLSITVIRTPIIPMEALFLIMLINSFFTTFEKKDEFLLPYTNWLPLDSKKWFFFYSMWEWYTLFCVVTNFSVNLALLYFLTLQTSSHMKILCFMLETKKFDTKAFVRHHQKIISLVKDVNELYSGQIFLELFLYGLQAGVRGFLCIKIFKSETESIVFLLSTMYINCLYLFFCYLHCLSGQEITKQSENMFVSAYQNSWYDLTVEDQKNICLIMCMTSKTLNLHYRNLMTFNMERFATIVQAMFSYISLLMGMDL